MLDDYRDWLSDKVYAPREYVEHQLNMSEEEQRIREEFVVMQFEQHEREKHERLAREAQS